MSEKDKTQTYKELFNWCLEQARDHYFGELSDEQVDKLNSIGFPWDYYEAKLDELDPYWKLNTTLDSWSDVYE